jgi:Family of unknown function (DUF5947)
VSKRLDDAIASRRRTEMVSALRGLTKPAGARIEVLAPPAGAGPAPAAEEACDLCQGVIPPDHRHLLNLYERTIVCVCEACWGLKAGDPELRPTGTRTVWLEGFDLPDDLWARFGIPIGLAFFMFSSVTECVIAMYPSPAGATESELRFDAWSELVALNPVLADLDPDGEALVVNRMTEPPAFAIAPIDRCYELVGLVKTKWEGISGGTALEEAVGDYFARLRAVAV